jgi:hypothetical protein
MRHVHFSHKVYTPKKYYDDFLRKSGEGVCECGHETTFRNAGNGYLEFCSHACFINSEKTRTNMSVKASGRKQSPETIQKRIANTNQLSKEKARQATCLEKYGVNNAILIPGMIEKIQNVCLAKYGTRSPAQRKNSSHGKWKNITIDGKTFKVQGYEDVFLERISEFGFSLDCLAQGRKNCPTIPWIDSNNVSHVYFPDFFVQSENLLIEIKSSWTFKNNEVSTIAKLDAAKKIGYRTLCIIFSSRKDKNPRMIT